MKTEYYVTNNKIKLAYYCNYVLNSTLAVIIIHGLAEHKGRYNDFINQLIQNNISTFAIDLRGHGESSGKRGDIIKFKDYLDDLHDFVSYTKEKYPNLKIGIFAHSLGGLIASSYVATYDTVDFLILSSPFLKAPSKAKIFKFIPYRYLGFIKLKKRHSESQEMLTYSKNDELACHYFTLRLIGNMFLDGVQYVNKIFKNIKLPVLVLGGKLDPLINVADLEEAVSQFGSADKTIKIYDNVKHCVVQNDYKDEIIESIINWIKNR